MACFSGIAAHPVVRGQDKWRPRERPCDEGMDDDASGPSSGSGSTSQAVREQAANVGQGAAEAGGRVAQTAKEQTTEVVRETVPRPAISPARRRTNCVTRRACSRSGRPRGCARSGRSCVRWPGRAISSRVWRPSWCTRRPTGWNSGNPGRYWTREEPGFRQKARRMTRNSCPPHLLASTTAVVLNARDDARPAGWLMQQRRR